MTTLKEVEQQFVDEVTAARQAAREARIRVEVWEEALGLIWRLQVEERKNTPASTAAPGEGEAP